MVAGEDVILRAANDIQDNGVSVAALLLVVMFSCSPAAACRCSINWSVQDSNCTRRSLRIESGGQVNVQQVSADTTINGLAQPINNLFVALVDADGPVDIALQEGTMQVGYVTSMTDVDLLAPTAILDAFPTIQGTFVNIFTPAGASPGHVKLEAGAIGSSTVPSLSIFALADSPLKACNISGCMPRQT